MKTKEPAVAPGDRQKALDEGAKMLVNAARRQLAQDIPELLPAIYLLPAEKSEREGPLWTDGTTLFYHPESTVRAFLENKKTVAEQLLHVLAHGLLGHCARRTEKSGCLFDAAADYKAADWIERLSKGYQHPRKWPQETKKLLEASRPNSLEQLCYTPANSEEAKKLVNGARPLALDDHQFWGKPQSKKQKGDGGQDGRNGGGNGPGAALGMDAMRSLWDSVQQQVAAGLAGSGKGDLAGELSDVYREAEESGVSYREFLRRFMDIRERVEIDPDSIDRIWYHVGLDLTGDVPIVEPEEIREDAGRLNLAVALDTSGSCHGDVMKGFLGELLAILRDSGGPRVEITLIQCDAEIQDVSVLTREDDAERIVSGFQTYGCGGTDFRPVFDYVDQCRESGEEDRRFRGLLYLSDGAGDFPDEPPDYPVAFLLPEEEQDWLFGGGFIPDWVTKVYIDRKNNTLKIEEKKD